MAGPIEILIVLTGFGIVGLFIFVAHFYIADSEKDAHPKHG